MDSNFNFYLVGFQELVRKRYVEFNECITCNKMFSTQDLLAQHAMDCDAITEENKFPCGDCDDVFTTSNVLKEHQYFKHYIHFECPISTCKVKLNNLPIQQL